MKRAFALLLVTTVFATQAQGSINLVTDHPNGTPLVVDAGTVSVDKMIVSINSDAADLLLGWQTTLWILPTGGTGTVGFNSNVEPVNYVFGTRSGFHFQNLSFPTTSDGMFAMDAHVDGMGQLLPPVTVPTSPGLNILELDFSASLDASGSFGVFAVGGAGRSEWTDPGFNAQLFNNINPTPDSHTQIGEIFANPVPEPGTFALALLALLGLLVHGHRPHRA